MLSINSSLIRKQNFLTYYQKARKEALIAKNIKNRWRATGLQLISIAKPLISPLLLENSNKTLEIPKDTESSTFDQTTRASQVIWSIPKKSTNIKA